MPNATKKRSRSEGSDNITPRSPKRSRLALWLATTELLTPHSVPLSPTGAAIWSGEVDLAIVNERLLERIQVLDSTSDDDSLKEWRRQYATDDESSPGVGGRARWDTPDRNEERSTPATIYGSDNSVAADCAPQGRASAKKHQETALLEPIQSQDHRPQRSCRQEQSARAFPCERLEDCVKASSPSVTDGTRRKSRRKIGRSAPGIPPRTRRSQDLEQCHKLKARVGCRAVAPRAGKRHNDGVMTKYPLQAPDATTRTRSGRASRQPVRWTPR